MDNRIKNRSKISNQKQLKNIARLIDENKELDKKYILVSSKLNHLKKDVQILKHDLRNPLFGITGLLDLLIAENKDQVEVQTSDLLMIKESAQAVLNLVNGTLVTDDTEISLEEDVNINRLLSSAMMEINRLYLPMAQNKNISLSLRIKIDTEVPLPPRFYINLIQITGNLVANAIKFTPPGGSVDVVYSLPVDDDHSVLEMTVTDTGKGMSPNQVSAFNQGNPVTKSKGTNGEKGSGTGLQRVIEMVSEECGRVFVESNKESGTTFSLSIPLPDRSLPLKSTTHFIVENGTVSHNGHHS